MKGDSYANQLIQSADELFLNSIVLGELLSGFMRGKKERKNRLELSEFLSSPRINILALDDETSERYAIIIKYLYEQGTPIPTNDVWIASSVMQYGLKLISRDNHYLKIPQILKEIF
jgi:tRNA(fMet)-specific endonuclease VapC